MRRAEDTGETMQILAGTSGYSYKEWKGRFYPEMLAASEMLRFYAERFNTVEINNTFYRMPDETMLSRWEQQVPADFMFAVKAPRRISHQKRLRDAQSEMAEFLERLSVLKNKLGPLLIQLPPFMKKDLPALDDFLSNCPGEQPIAFEFRHPSWEDDSVYELLRTHAVAFCIAETDEHQGPLISTSVFGYLRLRRANYDDRELSTWIEQIAAQHWSRAYVYFKHEDEARGPRFAQRFIELWLAMDRNKDRQSQ
jgi:uncharacterized protein YecE (DUF72 family)